MANIAIITLGLVLAAGAVLLANSLMPPMPVKFKNLDEENAVYQTALWAAPQLEIKRGDPRLCRSFNLREYVWRLNWMGSIPLEELAILHPFIDRIIDGKGPPLNQPAEYDDRPEVLRKFKQRMQAEGLWPNPQI